MPMYDFTCPACGLDFEEITDGSCPVCPQCGNTETTRKLSAPALKTNPAPFKIGPVRPQAPKLNRGPCSGGGCGCSC